MPELPEVETIARQIAERVRGKTIAAYRSDWAGVAARTLGARVAGRRITGVGRRGKLIVFHLDDDHVLLVSLRMTGRLVYDAAPNGEVDRSLRATFTFHDGTRMRFLDSRKFGRILRVPRGDVALDADAEVRHASLPLHARMGIEPLTEAFTVEWLTAFFARRSRAALKPLLLDQSGIAGLGNIYVGEALWRARVHPTRTAGSLTRAEVARLHEAIVWVLQKGIRLNGATLGFAMGDFADVEGRRGGMQREFTVYARAGEPCPRPGCGRAIVRTVVGARGTFHCPKCQKEPERGAVHPRRATAKPEAARRSRAGAGEPR
ncbi:MAG: bifunctional DNA-formamidopyrimidine glycosylase/DNA-(apurinic or apyrimidinic site) lyase [Chloroflexi bacterium]|nr:bifunctional DNA-formamidopyrimidine glycosylase/DNA-(apurinic or apyrimidinic site) lyase [Chloroflexota bacterium]